MVGLNFGQFIDDGLVSLWETTKTGERFRGLLRSILLDVVAGRLRENKETFTDVLVMIIGY